MATPKTGDVLAYERSFTVEEVRAFAALTGDHGRHHLEPDAQGRIMVHGLLTATIPTKLGGDLNYLVREIHLEFVRPVWVGDVIRCEATLTEVVAGETRTELSITTVCRNQLGKEVMKGLSSGVILHGGRPSAG
jgi:acyl dehydratase